MFVPLPHWWELANSEPLLSHGSPAKHSSQALLTEVGILWVSAGPQSLLRAPGASGAGGVPSHWSCVMVSLAVACAVRLGTRVLHQGPGAWSSCSNSCKGRRPGLPCLFIAYL